MRERDSIAACIGALGGLLASAPLWADPAAGQRACVECHTASGSKMTQAWRESKHAAHNVGCADCHGEDHSTIFERKGRVSANTCGKCHARQQSEFNLSLHAGTVDRMRLDPKFTRLSPVMAELGCMGCHQIGARSEDGSRGKCNACHSSHSFSVQEARRPEACAPCHTGPDHAQMAMWQASKHGQLFAAEETRSQAPTCVTCHMPGGSHNTSLGLSFGGVGSGAVLKNSDPPLPLLEISRLDAKRARAQMMQTCLPCHSSRFAAESLAQADAVKVEADAVLFDAVKIITSLDDEGILRRSRKNVEALAQESGHALLLGKGQPYDGRSPIEQRFFDMFKFHHASTFKGAYHHSPEFTHNEGFLRMKQDLTFIQHEAARLREAARPALNNTKVSP